MEILPPSEEQIRAGQGGARLLLGERSRLARCCLEREREDFGRASEPWSWGLVQRPWLLHRDSSKPEGAGPVSRGQGEEGLSLLNQGQRQGGRQPGPRALLAPGQGAPAAPRP